MRMTAIAFIAFLLGACAEKEKQTPTLQLGIEVLNPQSEQVVVYHLNNYQQRAMRNPMPSDTLQLDSINRAFWNVESDEGFHFIQVNRELIPIFLKPGKALNIQVDAENIEESVVFTGGLAKGNTAHYEINKIVSATKKKTGELMSLPEESFLKAIDSIRQNMDYLLMDFVGKKPAFSDYFIQQQSYTNYYTIASLVSRYAGQHDYYRSDSDTASLSSTFWAEYDKLNLNEPSAINNPTYQSFLSAYIQLSANMAYQEASQEERDQDWFNSILSFNIIQDKFASDTIKSYLFYNQANSMVSFYAPHINDSLFSIAMNNITDTVLVNHINTELGKWDEIAQGTIAPSFSYPDIDSNMVSLSDFRGKWVYVDVWATWCGPCKRQIPFLKNMERNLDHDKIAIVSVSVDRNKAAWEKMVADDNLKGVQLHAGGWQGITDDYHIKGIPRFILIDPDGRIYDPNFTDPSNGAEEEIKAIIIEP